jgi:hypothetical protein
MQKQKAQLTEYLSEHIEMCLEELHSVGGGQAAKEFICGETYAYVECLEIILIASGADDNALRELERKYGVI